MDTSEIEAAWRSIEGWPTVELRRQGGIIFQNWKETK